MFSASIDLEFEFGDASLLFHIVPNIFGPRLTTDGDFFVSYSRRELNHDKGSGIIGLIEIGEAVRPQYGRRGILNATQVSLVIITLCMVCNDNKGLINHQDDDDEADRPRWW